jgi:hypothetical protein
VNPAVRRIALVVVIAAALVGAACTSGGSETDAETDAKESSDRVDAARMKHWMDELVDFGIRRPGYPAEARAAEWIEAEFERAGLRNVRREPVEVNRWVPKECSVTWWSDAAPDEKTQVRCFALPYSRPEVDLTAPAVVDVGTNDIRGAFGVVRDDFQEIPQGALAAQALEVVAPQSWVDSDMQPIPFGFRNGDLFADFFGPTSSRGGAGFIGILDGLGIDRYYAPYTGEDVDLPAVWLGRREGGALADAIATGPTTARVNASAERGPARSSNVIGELPGPSDRWVVVGSHYDAPWASAVEDASGIAQVLAQAYHWASVPQAERPHELMFIATTGHMSGATGSRAIVESYPEVLDDTVLEVHLEHIAKRAHMTPSGLDVTANPETRWWFTTERADLQALVVDALRAERLDRDLVLPAVGFFGGAAPLSDAAPFSLVGVPVVSLITTPLYLFDPRDTPDKVHVASLEPVSRAATRMIAATKGLTRTRTTPSGAG